MSCKPSVCSIEIAQKLKEIGVPQESLWYWNKESITMDKKENSISAFTGDEVGNILPPYIKFNEDKWDLTIAKETDNWIVGYMNNLMSFLIVHQCELEVEAKSQLLYEACYANMFKFKAEKEVA